MYTGKLCHLKQIRVDYLKQCLRTKINKYLKLKNKNNDKCSQNFPII